MIRPSRLAVAALFGAIAAASAQHSTITRAQLTPRLDSLAKAYLAETGAPSVAVAVIRGRDTLAFTAFGTANIAASRAATPTTIYEIGSITKQFTSSMIMKLVEQGKIKLDDDMSKYVDFPLQGRHVTVRQLLNHTSGIHSYTDPPTLAAWQPTWSKDLTPAEIVAFVARDTFDFAPGTRYRYNNTGYVLLGMIIEKVTGQKYADYLNAQIFKPLGMTQTSYCPNHATDPIFAAGYSKTDGKIAPAAYLSLTHPFSAGALCSTVGDLVRWQRALTFGKVVSPESYTLMSTASTLNNGTKINYGFGLVPGTMSGHIVVGHTGGINGFATAAYFVPDDTLSVVTFTNFDQATPNPLAQNLVRVAYGEAPVAARPRGAPAEAKPLPPAERDAIVGTYALQLPNGSKLPLKVFVDNGTLVAQGEGQPANPITYLGDHVFGIAADPTLRITFVFDGGRVTKLTLLQNGATTEGPRVP